MSENDAIYIVGAGISGLIAAFELEKAGYSPIILEKDSHVGGRVHTVEKDSYHLDVGFQVLLSAYPMAQKYLDMEALKLHTLASGAQIYAGGKSMLIGDPLRDPSMLWSTMIAGIGSIADKIKVLRLNLKLKKRSIEEIFSRPEQSTLEYLRDFGFSEKIIERFFRPFFAGIFLETELRTSSRMFEFVYKMFGEGYATIPAAGIGAVSEQLKNKLHKTKIHFGVNVEKVTNDTILLASGDEIAHQGVILTSGASKLVPNMSEPATAWKSCLNLYFEIQGSNLKKDTIGLFADRGKLVNNIYAFTDHEGREILSATVLDFDATDVSDLVKKVEAELQGDCAIKGIKYIGHFEIGQALPELKNLRMTAEPSESILTEQIFLAGDVLFNGSLNAAMESGRLAALGLIERKGGLMM